MSDPAKSPASKLLLALRARKSQARKAGASPSPSPSSSSSCAGVHPLPLPLTPRPVMEEPAVTEDEEDLDRGRPVGNTSRSLEEEFENIRLEKPEDIKAVVEEFEEIKGEEKKLEDINVEEENLEDNKNGEEKLEHTEVEEEKLEDTKIEEERVGDVKVEEETRKNIYAKLIMAREKLTRARNQKEMLRELYEARKKDSGHNDWKDRSFEEMREEYVR